MEINDEMKKAVIDDIEKKKNDKKITYNSFTVIMKRRLKEQGINDTILALAWNIVEAKAQIRDLQKELKKHDTK